MKPFHFRRIRLADFNRGLKQLRASPEYARFKAKVRCPSSWTLL